MARFFTILFILISTFLYGQEDGYQANLKTMLQTEYGITGGTWVFSANEIINASNTTGGGGTRTLVDSSGQSITKAIQLAITTVPPNGWDAGMSLTSDTEQFVDTVSMISDLKLTYKELFSKVTGMSEWKSNGIKIYPNPSSRKFVIERDAQSTCQVALLTIKGRKINSFSSSDRLIRIDTFGLASGTYLVEVADKSGVDREKIIVR